MFTVCVPSTCTGRDVQTHINVALNSVNASAFVYDNSCSSKVPEPLKAKEWIVVFFIVLIVALVALSTAYENSSLGSDKNTLLCAFSLTTNGRQMLSTKTSSAALTCLNGLRVLAMIWVMTGHRMIHMLGFPALRPMNILERIDTLALAPVENTQLAVEIFFLMSGVLVTYGYLRYMMKGHKFNVFFFYVQRYCRLTPILAVMVALHGTIAFRFTDGPLWRRFYSLINASCDYNWWATLLYINNYYDPYNMCVQQSWFISSDFQFYVFSPVLLIPLYKRPKLGLKLIAMFLVITTVGGLWNAFANDLKGGGAFTFDRRSEDSLVQDYIVSHWRAASFLMGMALGYVLFKYKQGELILKLSRAKLWAGWLTSIFFLLFSVFFVTVLQNPEYEPNRYVDIPYMIFHRHMLSLGFAWIILACTLGHGGWVNQLLSWNVLIPFARLTYGAFLCHVMVQSIDQYSQRTPVTISLKELWYHVIADFTISYVASAVLYLTVEGPSSNITSWCFEGKKKPKEVPQNQTQTELPVFKYTV
uniref:Acyltransferase 3 domain-containing protein n=2 Tax=Graphocephala atropunctata TaxID=36148 RepID=A0A1B6KCS5_9HEMI